MMNEIAPAVVSAELLLAADHLNRYPGELVTLHLRFRVPEQPGVVLQLAMPRVMQAEMYDLPPGVPHTLPSVAEAGTDLLVLIPLADYFAVGEMYEIQIGARLKTFYANQHLLVDARLVLPDEALTLAEASLRLTVFGKAKYLQFLPEIYESDDFTSRFLMLFESFLKPVNQQIEQVDGYFDSDLTPPEFIPWLASWVGMPVDDSIPLDRMRTLVRHATTLFQRRGTEQALHTYLEIYTTGQVEIVERRAANFVLGANTVVGNEIALGTKNQPNTILVRLRVPASELERTRYSAETYQRKISDLVRGVIPAHVLYEVECAFE
ncbi:MAG: phage tail protein [Anaerolineae bacterium]|nr:phage tail protein [Anaerolineae bacterium]